MRNYYEINPSSIDFQILTKFSQEILVSKKFIKSFLNPFRPEGVRASLMRQMPKQSCEEYSNKSNNLGSKTS